MCPPRRYTASKPMVNRIRLRKSGMRKTLVNFSSMLLQDLEFAASRSDLFLGRLGKLMSVDGKRGRELPVTENFYGMLGADHASLTQHIRRNGAFTDSSQLIQIYNVEFLTEDVGEAAFRHTAMQRHLAAFKTTHHSRTTAGTLALMPAGRSLSHARSHAAAHALLVFRRLLRCS